VAHLAHNDAHVHSLLMPPAAQGVLEIKRVGFYLWVILHTGCAHAQPAVAFCCPRCEVKQGVAILLVAH